MGKALRRFVLIGIAALVAVLVFASFGHWALEWTSTGNDTEPVPARRGGQPDVRDVPGRDLPRAVSRAPRRGAPPGEEADGQDATDPEAVFDESDLVYEDPDAIAAAWASVDLEEVRRAMPDNLYFKLSAPTKNEAVLAERAAERDRSNVAYGKILSGTGTEEEIRAYYDRRARLSSDYIEFATYLLDHYGETLPERDVGLLELARRLHAARVQEIPRKVEEAIERKRQQDEARAAWRAAEEEFGGGDSDSE